MFDRRSVSKSPITIVIACIAIPILTLALALKASPSGREGASSAHTWDLVTEKRVSEIELPPTVLGKGWKASPGVRIDDLQNIEKVPAQQRNAAESLAGQLGPIGIRAVGDFTLVKDDKSLNTVTVRVFIFEGAERCRVWWGKKYEYDGSDQHYAAVASNRALCVDSRQTNKRAMAFGNVWLTAHQLGGGEEHIVALEYVAAQLRGRSERPGE